VIVALDLEGDCLAVAEIEDACILAGAVQDALAVGGQPLQQQRGVLVPAVLRPEEREDRELEMVRFAFEQVADTVELLVREAEGAVQRLLDDPRQESENRRSDGRVRLQK
jgi:hypothetical protein